MKPMKAFKFQDYGHLLTEEFYVQPKLNGVRALFSYGVWQSNDEKLWKSGVLQHLTDELKGVCPTEWILDGELYVHGWSLQQINGAVSINRNEPNEKTKGVEYHVFDVINPSGPNTAFADRALLLDSLSDKLRSRISNGNAHINVVATTRCKSILQAEPLYSFYRTSGYEGLMYRQGGAPYGFLENCTNQENRWKYLLKRKDWLDDEFEIERLDETEGEKGERGFQLWCRAKNGKPFKVGSGLSDKELAYFLESDARLVGKQARVKYEMLSDEGIPLKPTIEAILEE